MKAKIAVFIWKIIVRWVKKSKKNPVGIPYQRDPENPCEWYEPGKHNQYHFDNCETDGHYLCQKCNHRMLEEEI